MKINGQYYHNVLVDSDFLQDILSNAIYALVHGDRKMVEFLARETQA